jgi:hypothetical protein
MQTPVVNQSKHKSSTTAQKELLRKFRACTQAQKTIIFQIKENDGLRKIRQYNFT